MLLALVFLLTALLVTAQSTAQPQPYCHPVREKFSNNADFWLHATPVLRSHWSFDYVELVRRQYMDYWNGWKNISYLFALYVPSQEADLSHSDTVKAVTRIPAQASTSQGNNLITATH